MRKIIYTQPDGRVAVVHPTINTHPQREKITEAEAEQRAWSKLPKDAINPQFVDAASIPSDRTFRNAWKVNGAGVEVDLPKARELHREKLRELRAPLMASLDIEYMRADEAGDTAKKAAIAAKKQALRDVTKDPAIEAATTPEELKAVLPSALR